MYMMTTNISKSRGYKYENDIVNRFNNTTRWLAWRLGGTQIELPDILAVNNFDSEMMAIELKTGQANSLYVRQHQIQRLAVWTENLQIYYKRSMILGFKFHSKGKDGLRRPIREYYYQVIARDVDYKCNYDGSLYYKSETMDRWDKMNASEFAVIMPWRRLICNKEFES